MKLFVFVENSSIIPHGGRYIKLLLAEKQKNGEKHNEKVGEIRQERLKMTQHIFPF